MNHKYLIHLKHKTIVEFVVAKDHKAWYKPVTASKRNIVGKWIMPDLLWKRRYIFTDTLSEALHILANNVENDLSALEETKKKLLLLKDEIKCLFSTDTVTKT